MILFKDILTFLGLVYRVASLITLYLVVLGISIKKSDESDNFNIQNLLSKSKKSTCFKWTYGLFGNDYRVAALSNS